MATEQACRMLKTYRRKLNNSKESVDLDDLEDEVTIMLKVIQERKDRTPSGEGTRRRLKAKAATESDMDQLAVLMGKVNMAEANVNIKMNTGKDVTALKD